VEREHAPRALAQGISVGERVSRLRAQNVVEYGLLIAGIVIIVLVGVNGGAA
jgi:hypothetical protein